MWIALILWIASPIICTLIATKIGKSKILSIGFGILFPIASVIGYLFLWWEFKKKGKAKFTIF